MNRAEECRQRVTECLHEAKRAIRPIDQQHWIRLAEQWLKLAEEIEANPEDE
jgi:hypothetical protein